jgi:hypothetical protein
LTLFDFNFQSIYMKKYYNIAESVHVFTNPKVGISEILNVLKSAVKYSQLPYKQDFAKEI